MSLFSLRLRRGVYNGDELPNMLLDSCTRGNVNIPRVDEQWL